LKGENILTRNIIDTGEISWGHVGVPNNDISFVVRNVLTANVSFLSLFITGHLNYLIGNFKIAHSAFDAAMANIPENVSIENQSILHFFRVRKLYHTFEKEFKEVDYEDPHEKIGKKIEKVICEYADSIEHDSSMYLSYNNIGATLGDISGGYGLHLNISGSQKAMACLNKVVPSRLAIDSERLIDENEVIAYFFDKAYEINPNFTLAKYNKLAYLWNSRAEGGAQLGKEFKEEM
jgi:hypothetical protein